MTHTTVLDVQGMTCGHCVRAVTQEVSELDGVRGVDVVLQRDKASTVTVVSDRDLDAEALRAAVDEAGYTVEAIRSAN
jgi:copper chaperone